MFYGTTANGGAYNGGTVFDLAPATFTVTAGTNSPAPTHFTFSAPSSTLAGSVFVVTVTAADALGATASGYTGTVDISSSDGQAILSADATLTGGIGFLQPHWAPRATKP